MIEKWKAALRAPLDQVEFLVYVLAAGAIALFMSLLEPPWWCYTPPVVLLAYAAVGRYLSLRQIPGRHRK